MKLPGWFPIQIEQIIRSIMSREDLFIRDTISQHAPGIRAMVDSGQRRAAAYHLRAGGWYLARLFDQTLEVRRHHRTIATLKPIRFLK